MKVDMFAPDEKRFSFNEFLAALEESNSADLEPYDELVEELAKLLNVKSPYPPPYLP